MGHISVILFNRPTLLFTVDPPPINLHPRRVIIITIDLFDRLPFAHLDVFNFSPLSIQILSISRSVPVNNYVVVPYAQSAAPPSVYHHHQPALATQPIVPEVPHYVHPTKTVPVPSGPQIYYQQSPHHQQHSYIQSTQIPAYAPVQYSHTYPSGNRGPFSHYYSTPSLDLFGQYSRHTSLLDSYVPSNLVYSKARQVFGPYYGNSHVPSPIIPHGHQIDAEHSPIYNTIAYSTEQKPVVVPPPSKVTKRDSTILRPATAPVNNKPTTLTKVEAGSNKKN